MAIRTLTIDFYRIVMPKGKKSPKTFEELLRRVESSPADGNRWDQSGAATVGVTTIVNNDGIYEGEVARLRMNDGAIKGQLTNTELTEIMMSNEEALAEPSAFLYDETTKTLVLQRNRYGVNTGSFAEYFSNRFKVSSIDIYPCLKEEAIQRLANVAKFRGFEFRLAGVDNRALFAGQGRTFDQIRKLANHFDAPMIDIKLSMGRTAGRLGETAVVGAVRELWEYVADSRTRTKKLQVIGLTATDDKIVLDLLQDRIFEKVTLEIAGRTVPYVRRRTIIREAWAKHKEELENLNTDET